MPAALSFSPPLLLPIDGPQKAAWNMAVDEALLDLAAGDGVASLRFYQWSEPTVSLGYFQSYAEIANHPRLESATYVRRMSGGGALLHDQEITYSIAIPKSHSMAHKPDELYRVVHRELIAALAAVGLTTWTYGEVSNQRAEDVDSRHGDGEPFLCFERRSPFDIVARRDSCGPLCKLVGSAQRRRRGAILQHGSVLLSASPLTPQLLGAADLADVALSAGGLIATIQQRITQQLLPNSPHSADIGVWRDAARLLASEKYACRAWTDRR